MCIPPRTDDTTSAARSLFGLGALMLLACLAGPVLSGAAGALGVGVGGAVFALALCLAVPFVVRRRGPRARP